MSRRTDLHEKLCTVLGSSNVYFQPPESLKMKYPAIVYSMENISNEYADNKSYTHKNEYEVIIIDKDPDSAIPEKLNSDILCRFGRFYTSDNLNHWTFNLYY